MTLTVQILEADLSGVAADLDETDVTPPNNALGVGLRGDLNDPGAGTLFIHQTHPGFAEAQLGRVLQWSIDGTAKFWTFIDSVELVTVGPEKEKGKLVEGAGVLAYLGNATIRSRQGLGAIPVLRNRPFNWTSVEFVDSGWTTATEIVRQDLADPGSLFGGGVLGGPYPDLTIAGAPDPWPDPNAYWIHAATSDETNADLGVCYFRDPGGGYFQPPAQSHYLVAAAAGFYGALWLDGELLFEMHTGGASQVVELAPTEHRIAISNEVIAASVDAPNHEGGVICTVIECDENGVILPGATPLIHTDGSWLIEAYPASQPSMTPGHPLFSLLGEAQARVTAGMETLPFLILDFDLDDDTFGNPWDHIVLMSTKKHTDYLTFVRELVAAKLLDVWCEVDTTAAAIVLHAVPWGQRGSASGVTYQPTTDVATSNVTYASFRTVPSPNVLHVDWQGPDFEVVDETAIAAKGERVEAFLSLGAQDIPEAALALALAELDNFADDRTQVKVKVEPVGGDVPLLDCDLGDTALVVNSVGGTTATRLVGFDLRVEDNGHLIWGLEFGDQLRGDEDTFAHSDLKLMMGNRA